jgi:alanine racemase
MMTVHLDALTDNYLLLRSKTSANVAGVVKANAYGCGALEISRALYAAGCREFFVATPEEGIGLRTALPDDAKIYILGGNYHGSEEDFIRGNITPVLNSIDQIERWSGHARTTGQRLPAIIHVDTAMNRLGLEDKDVESLGEKTGILEHLQIEAVMSHFACSDEKDHLLNDVQAQRFSRAAQAFPNTRKSLCNSSGIFRNETWHYDLVRPGYALYGGNPTPEDSNPMRRVVDLSVRILQTKLGKKGESAGYGASHVFVQDTQLAIVALGYADGFLRAGSNKARLYWNGHPCPVVGRVSMDLIIINIGGVVGQSPEAGDWMEVLGPNQSVDDLASDCGTIGYEILTSLSRRAQKIYTTGQ